MLRYEALRATLTRHGKTPASPVEADAVAMQDARAGIGVLERFDLSSPAECRV